VTINHVAGGKDEDATKLNFVKTYAEKMVKSIANEAEVESRVISMPANRSATKVRKDAYQTVLNGSGYEGWSQEYKDFYGDFAQTIYEEILFPLNINLSDELSIEKREEIINYIERGELPNSKKKPTTRKKRTRDEEKEEEETPKQKTTRKSTRKKHTRDEEDEEKEESTRKRTGGKRKTRGKRRKNKNKKTTKNKK
jgi:hypothetical protein